MVAVLLVAVVAFVLRPGWRWEVVFQLVLALVEKATRRGERRRIRVAVQRKLSRRARFGVITPVCSRGLTLWRSAGTAGSDFGLTACTKCANGTYAQGTGQASCVTTPPGYYANGGTHTPQPIDPSFLPYSAPRAHRLARSLV